MIRNSLSIPSPEVVPLWCSKLSKWHGSFLGLNDISLELRPGITALLGSNGSGKSTLMNLIAGQLYPDSGFIRIFGIDPWTWEGKKMVGYSPDLDYFYPSWSIRVFLDRLGVIAGIERKKIPHIIDKVLSLVGLSSVQSTLLKRCSLGMRQRVKIAHALLLEPPLLILDEPFRGIDPVGRRDLVQLLLELQSAGKTILVSSHELDEIEKLTSRVVMLRSGRIVSAGPIYLVKERLIDNPVEIAMEFQDADKIRIIAQAIFRHPDVSGIQCAEEKLSLLKIQTRKPSVVFPHLIQISIIHNIILRRLEIVDQAPAEVMESLFQG